MIVSIWGIQWICVCWYNICWYIPMCPKRSFNMGYFHMIFPFFFSGGWSSGGPPIHCGMTYLHCASPQEVAKTKRMLKFISRSEQSKKNRFWIGWTVVWFGCLFFWGEGTMSDWDNIWIGFLIISARWYVLISTVLRPSSIKYGIMGINMIYHHYVS